MEADHVFVQDNLVLLGDRYIFDCDSLQLTPTWNAIQVGDNLITQGDVKVKYPMKDDRFWSYFGKDSLSFGVGAKTILDLNRSVINNSKQFRIDMTLRNRAFKETLESEKISSINSLTGVSNLSDQISERKSDQCIKIISGGGRLTKSREGKTIFTELIRIND